MNDPKDGDLNRFAAWLLHQPAEVQVRFEMNCRNVGAHAELIDIRERMQRIVERRRMQGPLTLYDVAIRGLCWPTIKENCAELAEMDEGAP